jgi:ornithine carbamoyltransferase
MKKTIRHFLNLNELTSKEVHLIVKKSHNLKKIMVKLFLMKKKY